MCFMHHHPRFEPARHLPPIADAGFAAIEVMLLCGVDFFDYTNPQAVDELQRVAADLDIVIWSLHEQDIPPCIGAADTAERQAAADEVRRVLDLAHRLGAQRIPSHLLMNPKFDVDAVEEALMEKRAVEMLHELVPQVIASGAKIAIENTGRRAWARPAALARRMATLPTEAYGFVIDTGHANRMSNYDELADLFADRLITLHLNDNHGINDDHLPPGKGTVDFSKIVKLLDDIGYDGCYLYEISGNPEPYQALHDTITAHRSLFA